MLSRLVIDSSNAVTELCLLGKGTGADKSPYNVTGGHRHPYTAVYNMLLAPLKNKSIRFAEIGVAMGASSKVWDLYFTNPEAQLCFFDRDENFLNYTKNITGERTKVELMDVGVDGDVKRALLKAAGAEAGAEANGLYDVILDDSSHEFGHQIRIIHEALPLLKSGGILIVEDVFRATSEEDYATALTNVINQCTTLYFVDCEHTYKWSPGWDNDKLLVLVKA